MDLARIGWLSTVASLPHRGPHPAVQGYYGYAAVTFAVALRRRSTYLAGLPAIPGSRGRPGAGQHLSRPHPVLGLEVDQHVRAPNAGRDQVLELVGGAVGVLERGPGTELDVQIDVAACPALRVRSSW